VGQEIPDENNPIAEQLKRLLIVEIKNSDHCIDPINRELAEEFPGSWLLVPLHFGGTILGSLTLGRGERPYDWQNTDMELICAIADQVAIAIHQSQLYEQSRSATATAQTKAEQLQRTLGDLQKAQAQLVQSEKMSSLGQLVAGVAHEINNPVNFIYANLGYARDYTEDILGLLQLYQQQFPNPTPEIWDEIVSIDLDFILEDLPKILASMKVGAERICEIIRSLRTFSRFAEAEMKAVDLHEGLDSTLMILQSRLKANGKHPEIQVIKEYEDLPKVECYAGQLNQVFMNLLANAIDAIDQHNEERSPEEIAANPSWIRVSTAVENDRQIAIRIADNGPGMTEQVRQRLFDPFFTTKPVGTGTGLGLSISYQIVVEKHRGQLHCHSELGQGTEFIIEIPLKHCCH
jgi:signal transduction histidine kinase